MESAMTVIFDASPIGTVGYVLAEPVDPTDKEAYRRIELVSSALGERDHVMEDIVGCLLDHSDATAGATDWHSTRLLPSG
jgi:hypothetical protein